MRSWRSAARNVTVRQRPCGTLAGAARTAPVAAGHVGLGPSFVEEHQAPRVKPALMHLPPRPPSGDVGAILLAGVQAFFKTDPLAGEKAPHRAVAAAAHPSAWPPHCRWCASAATISPRWRHSPQTAPPPAGRDDRSPPPQPPDRADPVDRVLPFDAGPQPSQHLGSQNPARVNIFLIQTLRIML